MKDAVDRADAVALARALAVRPLWSGVARASDVIDFKPRMLLHAGPPITDVREMAEPVKSSALMAICHEGWADDVEAADRLLRSGGVRLEPAQDHAAAIPLADVLSPGMPVLVVEDAGGSGLCAYSTINGGNGPVMRVGLRDQAVVERLHWIRDVFAPQLSQALQGGSIDMIDVADQALMAGDDCHGRTVAGSLIIRDLLLEKAPASCISEDARAFLDTSAAFFLNPWMASLKLMARAAEGVDGSGYVTALGGNGKQFGLQISAQPRRWFVVPATAPFIPGRADLLAHSSGAVGDSAIVDAFGCGAMAARAYAPQTWERVEQVCHERDQVFPTELLKEIHPAFHRAHALRTGLSVAHVQALGQTPVISIGVLDLAGRQGRLDGGILFSPKAPFEAAWHELEKHHAAA